MRNHALLSTSDDAGAGGTVALGAYRSLWWLLSPAIGIALKRRAARGKEDRERLSERYGIASRARPAGELIWIHGASVGECLAVLPLVARLLERENRSVLVTSGTVTSAQLMTRRLPERAFHQYAPIDREDAVKKFLGHWRPDLALFVESELWPNRVLQAKENGIPVALINARLSEKSVRGWHRMAGAARKLFSSIDVCLAQDARIGDALKALGAKDVKVSGSLKADSPPLPVDENALSAFRAAVRTRPVLLAAQTHPGEDEIVLGAAHAIGQEFPALLTVLVPRHPERGNAIADLVRSRGFSVVQRSKGELPKTENQVYVADTLGELGLFYRAAPFVFLGGSLTPQGGHNPLEPAVLGVSVLTGPYTDNFRETFDAILSGQGNVAVRDAKDLGANVIALLRDPDLASTRGAKAKTASAQLAGALDMTVAAVENLLERHARA